MLKTKLKLPYLLILSLFCICVGGSIFFGVATNDVRPSKTNEQKIVAQVESWISNSSYYATSFAGGTGSETDPYLISSAEELAYLSKLFSDSTGYNNYKDKYFKQTADINLYAHPWYPIGLAEIGNTDSSKSTFVATYDGDGFSISGIRSMFNSQSFESESYSHADTDDCALFGSVGFYDMSNGGKKEEGYVKNVVIDSSTIEGASVASIALYLYGEITNCKTTSSVSIQGYQTAAGIAQVICASSKIESCENRAEIICEDKGIIDDRYLGVAAGIVALGDLSDKNVFISKCANYGNVTMKKGRTAGGICGEFFYSFSLSIQNCFNTGNIMLSERTDSEAEFTYQDSAAVGMVHSTYGKVSNCYNVGEITSSTNAAGIMWGGQAENVFNAGKVSYALEGAAIAGFLMDYYSSSNLTLTNAYYGGNCDDIGGMPSNSTSGIDNSTYIADLDVQAKTQEFFESNLPTFNFETIWKIDPESNNGYPVFKSVDDIIAELMEFWFEKEEYYSTNFEGSGTKTDPYLISSAKELAGLSYLVLTDNENYAGKCYLQTADIDIAGKNFYPIGSYVLINGERILAFSGHYDGGGYAIYNLTQPQNAYPMNGEEYTPYLLKLQKTITALLNGEAETSVLAYSAVGLFGLVGTADMEEPADTEGRPSIKNVNVINAKQSGFYTGGVVGMANYADIENCYYRGNLSIQNGMFVGGICGSTGGSNIKNCIAVGKREMNIGMFEVTYGGIVAEFNDGVIDNCIDLGEVVGGAMNTGGGIVGDLSTKGLISNTKSIFVCRDTEINCFGGIIGEASNAEFNIVNCLSEVHITNSFIDTVGGIVGQCSNSSDKIAYINKCFASLNLTLTDKPNNFSGIIGNLKYDLSTNNASMIDGCGAVVKATNMTGENLAFEKFYKPASGTEKIACINAYVLFTDSSVSENVIINALTNNHTNMDGVFVYSKIYSEAPVIVGMCYESIWGTTTGIAEYLINHFNAIVEAE